MTELGETEDPRALIPGDPGAIHENVLVLKDRAAKNLATAKDLYAIDVERTWKGQAADAFKAKYPQLALKWAYVSDLLTSGKRAISAYASALDTAQHDAAEAIELWHKGEAQSRAHRDYVAWAVANGESVPVGPDPGEATKARAQAILAAARAARDRAAQEAGRLLREAADQAPVDHDFFYDNGISYDTAFGMGGAINFLATAGNAVMQNPLEVGAIALGGLAMAGGAALATGGSVVTVGTAGVAAPIGAPATAGGVALAAGGATMAAAGIASITDYGTENPVTVVEMAKDKDEEAWKEANKRVEEFKNSPLGGSASNWGTEGSHQTEDPSEDPDD